MLVYEFLTIILQVNVAICIEELVVVDVIWHCDNVVDVTCGRQSSLIYYATKCSMHKEILCGNCITDSVCNLRKWR